MVALATLLCAAALAAAPQPDTADAADFLRALADQAIAIHADESLSASERDDALGGLLERGFDLATIGRFASGRYWRSATPEHRQRYQEAFRVFFVRTAAKRFPELAGRSMEITGTRREGELDIFVATLITAPKRPPTRVMWRVRWSSQTYRIIDIIVEGVSMLITQRDDFASAIHASGGTLVGLIPILQKKTRTLKKSKEGAPQ